MNPRAFLNTTTSRAYSLPIVILYVTEGCNLQCITCSYRHPLPQELTLGEIEQLSRELLQLGLKHIVYSGGEPLLRRDFPQICRIFKGIGVKQTLLTNGLLLEKRLTDLHGFFSEIIVSIDGPDGETHNSIRGITSFDQIVSGVRLAARNVAPVSIRTVIQKKNFRRLPEMVEFAKSLNVSRISFLAADVLSESFGRDILGPVAAESSIALDQSEVTEFRAIIERMVARYAGDIETRFISESREKLFHLVEYFEALAGTSKFPRNMCNAPMVSRVITSTGKVQPCYFLPAYGNVRDGHWAELLNGPAIASVRKDVKAYTLDRCRTCVCTLHMKPRAALLDRF